MTGHLFGDRYQVGDTLGFGGMSEVHRGRDLRLGRDVAIKVLRADLARDPSFQTRFRREAQNAASLNHPAIVAVYDTGETEGETGPIPYIVMEYVDGETLRDLLKREGSLAPKRAMEIVADVCAALDFSHRHGIVHRDIKPANVMLTRAGAVKVMDFGIARAVADGQATMTATAAVIGTAQYLSPEQARGEAVDARSDVYATGCVLFELLVGAPPFTGDSPVAVAYQHVREDPKAPSEVKPGLPKELDSIVLKALNKNPLNRYQTAAEMRSDLVRALSGQAVHATPVMSDEERTQIMRAEPQRVGVAVAAGPSLLAPPRRPVANEIWEEDDEPADRTKKVWGYVGIGVLCLVLLGAAIFVTIKLTKSDPPPAKVAIPTVQNLTLAQAQTALKNANLVVGTVTRVENGLVSAGDIISSDPSAGTLSDVGTKVNLQVSLGLLKVTVPNLTGLSPDAAHAQITQLKLVWATPKHQKSTDAQKDTVMLQSPAQGTAVKPGTTVTVTVGDGPTFVVVPDDLVGKTFAQATDELEKLGLSTREVQVDSTEDLHKVTKVADVGQRLQAGTTIDVTTSNNALFTMPNITNQTVAQATANLKVAGWTGTGLNLVNAPTFDGTAEGLIPDAAVATVDGANAVGPVTEPQVPKFQTTTRKNAVVTVVVYVKARLAVPSFTAGQTLRSDLDFSGFANVTQLTQPWAAGQTPGTVLEIQGASSGAVVPFDTALQIVVVGEKPLPPTPTTKTTPTSPTGPTSPSTPPTTPATTTPTQRPGGG